MFISLVNQPDDEPPTLQKKKNVSVDIEMSVVLLACTFRRGYSNTRTEYLFMQTHSE